MHLVVPTRSHPVFLTVDRLLSVNPEKKTFTNRTVELEGWSVVIAARGDKWD
ncbi:MAG: hypothetical protein M0T73_06770 [Deltaproteobacteria bacterium]|nr:hypothetical protein [Deltaproteobacteria bacterium]